MQDRKVLGEEVELQTATRLQLAASGEVRKSRQADAALPLGLLAGDRLDWLLLLVFGVIACDLAGRQQLGQPPQFPDLPRAPLAWR